MSDLAEKQIEHAKGIYIAAGIVCLAGVVALIFYPLPGIGLILFGGFLLYWSLATVAIAVNRDMSEKMSVIIAYLQVKKSQEI